MQSIIRWVRLGALLVAGLAVVLLPTTGVGREAGARRASWRQEAELVGRGHGAAYNFGSAIAVGGSLVAVSEPRSGTESAVHLFRRAAGVWGLEARLAMDGAATSRLFGAALAVSGDTVAIGSPGEGDGAVYVYERQPKRLGGAWTLQARLAAPSPGGPGFGSALALAHDTLVVGAPDDGGTGAAYVLVRHRRSWGRTARLVGTDSAQGDRFGTSVAIDGASVVVGAPLHSGDPGERLPRFRGAAYVFTGGGGRWGEEVELGSPNLLRYQFQGFAVAVSGDLVVAGSGWPAGGAHGFRRTTGGWVEEGDYFREAKLESYGFGGAVAADRNRIALGCPWTDLGEIRLVGAVHVLERGRTGELTTFTVLDADDPEPEYELYGDSVALDGDILVVSAPQDRENGPESGAVYVYHLR